VNSIEYDLGLAEVMLGEFDAYLNSRTLFWPLGHRHPSGGNPYPMLSSGGLLLVLDELRAQEAEMDADQRHRWRGLLERFESTRRARQVAMETKSAAEANSRLNLWRAYIHDIETSEAGEWGYRNEVRQRVMLARLLDLQGDDGDVPRIQAALADLDRRLRARFSKGEFVWDERLQAVYSPERFWYLYGRPRFRG
jgi:hypothetical protein